MGHYCKELTASDLECAQRHVGLEGRIGTPTSSNIRFRHPSERGQLEQQGQSAGGMLTLAVAELSSVRNHCTPAAQTTHLRLTVLGTGSLGSGAGMSGSLRGSLAG